MPNRKLPFGYMMRNGEICADPMEAKVVRDIYAAYADSASYRQLTERLNAQPVRYRSDDAAWNKNMAARILQDERYIGDSGYPRIIPPELFQRARAAKPDVSGTAERAEIKDIRILARCADCGASMKRERKNYWRCPRCMESAVKIRDDGLIQGVGLLLNRLREYPDAALASSAASAESPAVQLAQVALTSEMDKPQFDEAAAKAQALALASVQLNTLCSADYETMRIQRILSHSKRAEGLDTALLRQIAAAILIWPSGAVSVKLKNGQMLERSESP
ncbi:MAG: recombinase family protein [Oscillospiraceae bacterium]|nr:recombinase family protein [Oscillospiraceae bacterium]